MDVDRHGALPVTTPSRSLIDAAPRLRPAQIETALDVAARTGLIRVAYLRWRVEELRRQGRRGIGKVLDVLPAQQESCREESWLERRFTALLRDAGLPPPRLQRRVRHPGGRARVDAAYEEASLAIEVDGHATHATRRERQADAERDARLLAAGWRVVRFTYEDVTERPGYVADTIRTFLGLPAVLVTQLVGDQPDPSPNVRRPGLTARGHVMSPSPPSPPPPTNSASRMAMSPARPPPAASGTPTRRPAPV